MYMLDNWLKHNFDKNIFLPFCLKNLIGTKLNYDVIKFDRLDEFYWYEIPLLSNALIIDFSMPNRFGISIENRLIFNLVKNYFPAELPTVNYILNSKTNKKLEFFNRIRLSNLIWSLLWSTRPIWTSSCPGCIIISSLPNSKIFLCLTWKYKKNCQKCSHFYSNLKFQDKVDCLTVLSLSQQEDAWKLLCIIIFDQNNFQKIEDNPLILW